MQTSKFLSLTDDNRGVFEILAINMAAAKRGTAEIDMQETIYRIGLEHDIDPWEIDEAAKLYNQEIKQIA